MQYTIQPTSELDIIARVIGYEFTVIKTFRELVGKGALGGLAYSVVQKLNAFAQQVGGYTDWEVDGAFEVTWLRVQWCVEQDEDPTPYLYRGWGMLIDECKEVLDHLEVGTKAWGAMWDHLVWLEQVNEQLHPASV